jgi:hypothetical protein
MVISILDVLNYVNTDCFSNGIPPGFPAAFPDEFAFLAIGKLTIRQFVLFKTD